MKQMQLDPELVAMNRVSEVLKYLGHGQRRRVIDWAKARFNLIEKPLVEVSAAAEIHVPGETSTAPSMEPTSSTQPTPPAQSSELEPEPQASVVESEVMKPKPTAVKTTHAPGKIFADFDTIEDLFLMANAKKISHRILLVSAYLQEKGNLDEVSSLDINSHLKKLGYGVSNITTLINGLLKKIPPQIIVTKKEGDTKQSRRKFRVTERGFKDAESFITISDNK